MTTEGELTEKLVLEKTKLHSLEDVQRLDLWGEALTDISLVAKLPRLQVLGLASNNVSSLKVLQGCITLEELYLRKNNVSNLREVTELCLLPNLHVLWLRDNPCAQHPHYRDFVLHCCPGLKQLDGTQITSEERTAAAKRMTPKVLDEILGGSTPHGTAKPPSPQLAEMANRSPSSTEGGAPSHSTSGGGSERAAMIEERSANGRTVLFTTVAAQRAMLLSIVSLLSELTVDSLQLLQREVQERIQRQKDKIAKFPNDG